MTRLTAIHLRHADEVHVVDDVREDDLLDLDRRRHEIEQRSVSDVILHDAGRDHVETFPQPRLLGVRVFDLLAQRGGLTGVLTELLLDLRLFSLGLLPCQLEIVELLRFLLGNLLFARDVAGAGRARRLEVVAVLVVGRLRRLVI